MKRWTSILLAGLMILSLCAACGGENKAATMWLRKTTGEVWVSNEASKAVDLVDDMGLYSGYRLDTWAESYAWIDLDSVKLAKLDEDSGAEIRKDGRDLEILVNTGSIFFNVTEPLEEDETMTIRTSSMLVGIRGTCGWVVTDGKDESQVYILEGVVEAEAEDTGETVRVSAGEMAEVSVGEDGETKITVSRFSENDIAGFVMDELDEDLMEEVRPLLVTPLSGEELEATFLTAFDACGGGMAQDEAQIAQELKVLTENTADSERPLPEDYEAQFRSWREAHTAELAQEMDNQRRLAFLNALNGISAQYARLLDFDQDGVEDLLVKVNGYNDFAGTVPAYRLYRWDGAAAQAMDLSANGGYWEDAVGLYRDRSTGGYYVCYAWYTDSEDMMFVSTSDSADYNVWSFGEWESLADYYMTMYPADTAYEMASAEASARNQEQEDQMNARFELIDDTDDSSTVTAVRSQLMS